MKGISVIISNKEFLYAKITYMKKAIVAMSGGLDSSVTALILQKEGYEVIGVTGLMLDTPQAELVCNNAKAVADKLGIEHHVIDVSEKFNKEVVSYFENSYKTGLTPNPCIQCNKFIKWGELFDTSMQKFGADVFATGHYAEIRCIDGVYKLYPAKDEKKDQLYFLYKLSQDVLARTVFPLCKYEKREVRQIAEEYNLPPKSAKESQDICFIQKPCTTKKYLLDKFGTSEGIFVEKSIGKIIGRHDGFYQYTIGQRKGIGIAYPYPLYVLGIDAEKNIVYLGKEEENYFCSLSLKDISFSYPVENKFNAMVKIRYNMAAKPGMVDVAARRVVFDTPVNSVTPGQACVFYSPEDGHLIGGGEIE